MEISFTNHHNWMLFEIWLHINISFLYEQFRYLICWYPLMISLKQSSFREAPQCIWVLSGKCGIRELCSLMRISSGQCVFEGGWIATAKKFPCMSLSVSGDFGHDSVKWNFQLKWESHGPFASLLIVRVALGCVNVHHQFYPCCSLGHMLSLGCSPHPKPLLLFLSLWAQVPFVATRCNSNTVLYADDCGFSLR